MDYDEVERRGKFRGDRLFLRLTMGERMGDYGCLIAHDMRLNITRTLTPSEKVNLLSSEGKYDISQTDRHNFLFTPLMLETTDWKGQTVYLAVAIAYVAEVSDADVAIRTAEHLARLTGHPARPVIAARVISDHLDEMVEAEQVFWHELHHSFLEEIERPPETEEERALNDAATARLMELKRQGMIR